MDPTAATPGDEPTAAAAHTAPTALRSRWARSELQRFVLLSLGALLLLAAAVTAHLGAPATFLAAEQAGHSAAADSTPTGNEATEGAGQPQPGPVEGATESPRSEATLTPPRTITTSPARLEDQPPPAPQPIGVRIPDLSIDAPVDAVGLDPDGAMEIPADVRRAGWFQPGAGPADTEGSAVLSAHVDDVSGGAGAFYRLKDIAPDTSIIVDFEDGSSATFTTTALTRHPRNDLPVAELFRRDGPPTLTLITCGGRFDPVARSYEENVVVRAVP